ncbi:hypothetical protein SeMB42_g07884 [Synchytrium endobioticum]|nr:hypothetical protein SeMB42_g07884 [Synchytrium endobioticum]
MPDRLPLAVVRQTPAKIRRRREAIDNLPSSSPPDDLSLHPIHPRGQYREEMRALRRQWLDDIKLDAKAKAHRIQLEQEQEAANKHKLQESMKKFILQQQSGFSSFRSSTPPDDTTSSATESTGSEHSTSGTIDPALAAKRQAWHDALKARRQRRLSTYLTSVSQQTETKLENLLYLYHSAVDFVTYANLDAKIEAAMDKATSIKEINVDYQPFDSIPDAIARHHKNNQDALKRRETALNLVMEGRLAGQTYIDKGPLDISVTPAIGPQLVREWKIEHEARGGDAAVRRRDKENRLREAVHDNIYKVTEEAVLVRDEEKEFVKAVR